MCFSSTVKNGTIGVVAGALVALSLGAQQPEATHHAPWRGAGPQPCYGIDDGINQCKPETPPVAVRAGLLFDSKTGAVLTDQVLLIDHGKIVQVGPASKVKIPAGMRVIDLSQQMVLPGLMDLHTHMFDTPRPGISREMSDLIAVEHVQADLNAGFTAIRDMSTHGNGYDDVDIRNAINQGIIEGPRAQVSTRGIVWAGSREAEPNNPLAMTVVHNVDDARAAVRDQIAHGADWIKLFPTGGYKFDAQGHPTFEVTYPMPVLQALIDETHRLGKKTACHVFGGEGQRNAILAGCDSIEHALDLTQDEANMMAAKHLTYDPTLQRYTEPSMDDADKRGTGGKYRMIPIFEASVTMASHTKGLKITVGSGAEGSTLAHGTQALEYIALVQEAHMTPTAALEAGTMSDAEVLGWADRIGSLDKGKFADLIAVPGNAVTDITELNRVDFVMKGGVIVRNDLYPPKQ
jgi:imidazolonepropionase-like amidohydrolase